MKVKAADIARKLKLSKATVSLALNHKPGVSSQTREAVFKCLEELENGTMSLEEQPILLKKQMIKLIIVNKRKGIISDSELDLWSDVFEVFDRETKRLGYTLGITYAMPQEADIKRAIEDANQEEVAGIILDATEMEKEDFLPFLEIHKPLVIYDNDLDDRYHCAVIDNSAAVGKAVDYLAGKGCRDICYLANEVKIYNFARRRAGFLEGLHRNGMEVSEGQMVAAGTSIEDVYQKMGKYLDSARLPDAFIMENYQVSIGTVRALRERGIRIPEDISLIGIDELPSYLTADVKLTTIRVAHAQRAQAVMMFLEKEIKEPFTAKFKLFSNSELIEGDSVRKAGF